MLTHSMIGRGESIGDGDDNAGSSVGGDDV